jgi:hypothetical protein
MREPHVFALQYFAIMAWKTKEKQAGTVTGLRLSRGFALSD